MAEKIAEVSLILLLLVFSYIFSGSEVSLFSLSEVEKLKLSQKKNPRGGLILRYLGQPQKTLITILIGNMIVNLSASIVGERLSDALVLKYPLFFSVFIMTFMVLLFGEIIPKKIAAAKPTAFALRFIRIVDMSNKLFFPLILFMSSLIKPRKESRTAQGLSKDELISAVEASSSAGLDTVSIRVLKNLISHIDKPVTDIMVPRSDIQAADIDGYWKITMEFIKKTPYSTVLFFKDNVDNILGYLLKTELLFLKKKYVKEKLRPLFFVPESKSIFSLLHDFKQKNEFIAVVLDEYGGTSGLVTLKDVLDSIFIQDLRLKQMVSDVGPGKWRVTGNTKLSDLNALFNLNLPVDSVTLSGYIINMTGTIPEEGTTWSLIPGYRIHVEKSDSRQIALVELTKSAE